MQALQITSHPQNSFCSFTSAKISERHSTTVHDFGVCEYSQNRGALSELGWHGTVIMFVLFIFPPQYRLDAFGFSKSAASTC